MVGQEANDRSISRLSARLSLVLGLLLAAIGAGCAAVPAAEETTDSTSKGTVVEAKKAIVPLVVNSEPRNEGGLYCWYLVDMKKGASSYNSNKDFTDDVYTSIKYKYKTVSVDGARSLAAFQSQAEEYSQKLSTGSPEKLILGAVGVAIGGILTGLGGGIIGIPIAVFSGGGLINGAIDSVAVETTKDFARATPSRDSVIAAGIFDFGVFEDIVEAIPVTRSARLPEERAGFCEAFARRFVLRGGSEMK